MIGKHMIKSWSSIQNVIALSSGEAEYYGLVKGAAQGLGVKAMYLEAGQKLDIEVKTDASAAKGIAMRRGMGKIRHIEVSQLWVQDRVARGDIKVTKVDGTKNIADHLTKYLTRDGIEFHLGQTSQKLASGRHEMMPEMDS